MNLEKEHIMPAGHCPLGIYSHRRRNSHLYIIIFATDRFGNSTCLAIAEFRLFGKHYIPGVELFFHFKIHMDPLGPHIFLLLFPTGIWWKQQVLVDGISELSRVYDLITFGQAVGGCCHQWCSTNIMLLLMLPEGWFKICRWRDTHTETHVMQFTICSSNI